MVEQEGEVRHPMQPVTVDKDGVARFKQNAIVRHLVNTYPNKLNGLAEYSEFSAEDWEQLAQLIGYSVSGFGDLGYVSERAFIRAAKRAKAEMKAAELRGRRAK